MGRPAIKPPRKSRGSVAATTTMKDFGARLKRLREARNLSRIELARLLDCENAQVYRYEKNENVPSAEMILKLSNILHVSCDELLKGKDHSEPTIRSPKLFDRFRRLDDLPKERQEAAMTVLDAIITQHEFEAIAGQFRSR
jgi:transcriptional regulator with XRE-family HTH domain